MDHFDLIINFIRWWWHSWSRKHTERCRNSVPTCLLPSQHAGKYARTLAQVGVCFSQLREGGQKRQVLISILIKQFHKVRKSIKISSDNTIPCLQQLTASSFNQKTQTGRQFLTRYCTCEKNGKNILHLQQGTDLLYTDTVFLNKPQTCQNWKNVMTVKSLQLLLLHSLVPLASLKSNLRRQN